MNSEWFESGEFGPEPELLETDIAQRSHNKCPWSAERKPCGMKSNAEKVILSSENLHLPGLSDLDPLQNITERSPCPICRKERKFFCYDCYVAVEKTEKILPRLTDLPCKIDVIKHPSERQGKVIILTN